VQRLANRTPVNRDRRARHDFSTLAHAAPAYHLVALDARSAMNPCSRGGANVPVVLIII
jgi:hypothetical protein